jgi:hypothetical protein
MGIGILTTSFIDINPIIYKNTNNNNPNINIPIIKFYTIFILVSLLYKLL